MRTIRNRAALRIWPQKQKDIEKVPFRVIGRIGHIENERLAVNVLLSAAVQPYEDKGPWLYLQDHTTTAASFTIALYALKETLGDRC